MAAYVVVTAHCAPALTGVLGSGTMVFASFLAVTGVEFFFALSGFLIGGILLDLRPTAANLGTFVLRRWFRTLPVYYLALLVFLAFPLEFNRGAPGEPWQYFVFLQNVTSYPKFFSVSWSLAIEEWFYLLLPLCLLFRIRYLHAVALIIGAGVLARLYLPIDDVRASVAGRPDAIAYGCLVAWLMRSDWRAGIERHARLLALAGMAGTIAAYACFVMLTERMQLSRPAGAALFTAFPLLAAMTLPYFAALRIQSPQLARMAVFGAAVSYPLYVWHTGLIHALSRTQFHPGTGFTHVATVFLGATALAYLTHVLVERPIMALRPEMPREKQSAPGA
jgi:peptidoglycan/LPS O-acetylase OafA/YrhL